MATEPNVLNPPSVQTPQTNFGILQHSGSLVQTTGLAPGDQPDKDIHMARSQMIFSMQLTTDITVGNQLSILSTSIANNELHLPILPTGSNYSTRNDPAHSCQIYFNQTIYWNASVSLHFWAVKPPTAVGRLRITFTPMEYNNTKIDVGQREITEEWDLSASNIFEFKIPSYNLRNYRNCIANYAPLNGSTSTYVTPGCDFKLGRIRVFVTHLYQPGSIYPNNCNIYCFQSFANAQFAIVTGPAVPRERTALTHLRDLV